MTKKKSLPVLPPRRMSATDSLQYCTKSVELNIGAGRAAAMGSAFHALCSGQGPDGEDPSETLARLSPEERAEIQTWHKPEPLEVNLGETSVVLEYANAMHEVELMLAADGDVPQQYPELERGWAKPPVLLGHADMIWYVDVPGFGHVAVVGDIKKSRWTSTDGPRSLQLHSYGMAAAVRAAAKWYFTAIWVAEDGYWILGDLVEAEGFGAVAVWERLLDAATRVDEEYSTGPHCDTCYARLRCPAHMVVLGQDELAVPGTLITETLTPQAALMLLLDAKRAERTVKAAKDYLKAWVRECGPIPDGNGKAWGPIECKNPESVVSARALREALGEEAEQFIRKGGTYTKHDWSKHR